jgi:hypothetical protein
VPTNHPPRSVFSSVFIFIRANDILRLTTVHKRALIRTIRRAGRANTMANPHLRLVAPATVKRTVAPKRPPNRDLRTREYLTERGDRSAHRRSQGQSLGPPGCDYDPDGISARPAISRSGRSPLGSGGLPNGDPARPQSQGGYPQHASHPGRRAARVAPPSAGANASRHHEISDLSAYN